MSLEVAFDGVDATSKIFSKDQTASISIDWNPKPNKYYALLIYDVDVPHNPPTLIHLFTINIGNGYFGDKLLPWMRPNPPDKTHRYYVDLFEQKTHLGSIEVTRETDPKSIEGLRGLTLIKQIIFKVKP